MSDHAESAGGDALTSEEQAQLDAYESGSDLPAAEPQPAGEGGSATPEAPAAAPDPAPPGDVVDPDDETGSPEDNRGRFVRHGAFHAERERRKAEYELRIAAEKELAQLREMHARGDERLRILSEAMNRPAPPAQAEPQAPAQPETPPDPNEDIFGYAKHLERQIAELRTGQQQMTTQQREQAEAARVAEEERTVVSDYQRDVARFAAAEPQFVEAYNFLLQGRMAEFRHLGLSDADASQAVRADEMALIRGARQRGISPAEHVFAMAKLRGFAPPAPAPAAPAAPAETPAQKAARIAAGQAGPGRSLSAAGGAPAGEITLEMLASMSEADFEKLQRSNPARVRRLMGGEE